MQEITRTNTQNKKREPAFNPERMKLIRERRGLSVAQLSRESGVAPRTIHGAEKGDASGGAPSAETLRRLSVTLAVPPDFFFLDSVDRLEEGAVSFRRATKVPAYQRKSALAAGDFAFEIYKLIAEYVEVVKTQIPDLSDYRDSPVDAADALRAAWGIGSGPAPNMIHLLESKGVFVTALASDFRQVDAFSFWRGDRPFVMLNTLKSGERGRMDAAHELAHLVLHRLDPESPPTKDEEAAADAFGGAFLVPSDSIRSAMWRSPMLETVLEHKKAWRVAATLFVRRLKDVGLLTPWAYRNLMIELSQRGYRSGEPGGIERESSSFFQGSLQLLRQDGIRVRDMAKILQLEPEDLREYLFGLVLA